MILLALSCLLVAYATVHVRHILKRRRLSQRSWHDLVNEIQPVNSTSIASIAECYLKPTSRQLRIEPDYMWMMIGEAEGLRTLKHNAGAMLDLAVYAVQWNPVEGRIVSEMMRRDAVRLDRAIRHIERALLRQRAEKFAAFELQEAVASYQLMRGRLLALYQVADVRYYQRLAEAV